MYGLVNFYLDIVQLNLFFLGFQLDFNCVLNFQFSFS